SEKITVFQKNFQVTENSSHFV
uniref:Chlorophyllase type 2 (Fragments) n=1 Tax=Chenopodium album TaxID=3559 RepID=CLH2_CHEAL|nr:RecName: Full=Chlorophyllase type 2; AltName: Full=CaCLH2; AltName: Full=Chlorophyll-chlorophyllido hydrolase 2; Short=Chlase 2 [Chenopodium album]